MMAYKNIRIKMKGGKSRMQRVKVLKSGKYKFVKNLTKSRSKSVKTRRKSVKKTRRRSLTKKRQRGKRKFTIPVAPVVGLIAGLAEPLHRARYGDWDGAIDELSLAYLGYSTRLNKWSINSMARGAAPLLMGLLVHKTASLLGVNRMLAQAGVPIIRI